MQRYYKSLIKKQG